MHLEIISRTTRHLTAKIDAKRLEAGRAYRLVMSAPGGLKPAQVRSLRVGIGWSGDVSGGGEYFPFPKRGELWRPAVQEHNSAGCIEFRCPAEGVIEFEITCRGRTESIASILELELYAIAPQFPTRLLRSLSNMGSSAQDRCSLLRLSSFTENVVPLRPNAARSYARRPLRNETKRESAPSIAFIGSSELFRELSYEAEVFPINESDWQYGLRRARADYLLIDPVLHVDNNSWRYSISRHGDRTAMLNLLQHCHSIGLPVVTWFRVDAQLYEEFSWLVSHSDHVYAVDKTIRNMIHAEFPTANVQVLPPCIQPKLHNPFTNRAAAGIADELSGKVLLDSWWRLSSAGRERILKELRTSRLLVSESEWEFSFTRLETIPEYRWNTLGCLDPAEKALLTKLVGAELFLLDDAIPNWRRDLMLLRSAASGCTVLFRNEGVESAFAEDEIYLSGGDEQLLRALTQMVDQPLARARRRLKVSRRVLQRHTYRARLSKIADDLGLPYAAHEPKVACLLVSMRPWLLDHCIERFSREEYPNKELVIVVHGSPATARELAARAANESRIRIHQAPKSLSLGACLNFAAQQTDAPLWAKLDDDDIYGSRYLADMVMHQGIVDASLLAKPQAFLYLEGSDEVLWHPKRASRSWKYHNDLEVEPTAGIAGGTLFGTSSLLRELPFSETRRGGSDSEFVLRARRKGHNLMVTDPFNFAFFRSSKAGFHTWDTDSNKLRTDAHSVGNVATMNSTVFA